MWKQIIKSMSGDYIAVDYETSALKPSEGVILGEGYVHFNISFDQDNLWPRLRIVNAFEFWKYAKPDNIDYKHLSSTMTWHRESNEAWKYYADLYAEQCAVSDEVKIKDDLIALFKGGAKFISRHAFDALWADVHRNALFNAVHYRNFIDVATLLSAYGLGGKEDYTKALNIAMAETKRLQENGWFSSVPQPRTFVQHRPFTDCLIDIHLIRNLLAALHNELVIKGR